MELVPYHSVRDAEWTDVFIPKQILPCIFFRIEIFPFSSIRQTQSVRCVSFVSWQNVVYCITVFIEQWNFLHLLLCICTRNILRSIIIAVPLVTMVYFMMNVAYMTVLSIPEMTSSAAVAVVIIVPLYK